jgi:hypothetical protein
MVLVLNRNRLYDAAVETWWHILLYSACLGINIPVRSECVPLGGLAHQ